MDSLLANYASSDEEEENQPPPPKLAASPSALSSSSLFSSLSKPKSIPNSSSSSSSSLFQSLPLPKESLHNPSLSNHGNETSGDQEDSKPTPKSSSVFPTLPRPKSQKLSSDLSPSQPNPKRVIQFKPPVNPYSLKSSPFDDEDDEEEDRKRERRRRREAEFSAQPSSVKSFLSTIPAPKNSVSLGVLPSSGSGRRAVIDANVSPSNSTAAAADNESNAGLNGSGNSKLNPDWDTESHAQYYSYANYETGNDQNAGNYGYFENHGPGYSQPVPGVSGSDGPSSRGYYDGYGSYVDNGQCGSNNWVEGSPAANAVKLSGSSEIGIKGSGKRGRNEIPKEIIEVKQDELIKNRPREDQVKLTGVAFGPSYQPVSTKGKPTKLHKRKHQIGSLYFDMKQKEMELSERRAKGFLTKAETQAKYGW